MNARHLLLSLVIAALLALAPQAGHAQDQNSSLQPPPPETILAEQKARQIFDVRIPRDLGFEYPIQIEELALPELASVFPGWTFYRAEGGYQLPPGYTVVAVRGTVAYGLPEEFNNLLIDAGVTADGKAGFAAAKAFVLTTKAEVLDHRVEFRTEEEITEHVERYDFTYKFKMLVWTEVNGITEEWKFAPQNGQWRTVQRHVLDTGVGDYQSSLEKPLPPKGANLMVHPALVRPGASNQIEAILQQASLGISTDSIVIAQNGNPTGASVTISVSGFDADVDVAIWADSLWGEEDLLSTSVRTDASGSGSYTWTPAADSPTDITDVWVRGAVGGAEEIRGPIRLIVEETKTDTLAPGYDLTVYYCSQFPFTGSDAETFSDLVVASIMNTYNTQVTDWGFRSPPDVDNNYEIAINDSVNDFHGFNSDGAAPGTNRLMHLNSRNFRAHLGLEYSSVATWIDVVVAHEFYHGIEWAYNQWKGGSRDWYWMIEGQARFIQSVQYEAEEFNEVVPLHHSYPDDSNDFLTQGLNTGLRNQGYWYCLYWRFLYEHYRAGTTRQRMDILRHALEASDAVGSNAVVDGETAMDNALRGGGGNYSTFDASIRAFSRANYLLRLRNTDPAHVMYDHAEVYTANIPLEHTHTFNGGSHTIDNSVTDANVPPFGMDFIELTTDQGHTNFKVTFESGVFEDFDVRLVKIRNGIVVREWPISLGVQLLLPKRTGNLEVAGVYATQNDRIAILITRLDTHEILANGNYRITVDSTPIGRGLDYLHQRHSSYPDGSWSYNVGITGLSTLAFLNYGYSESDPDVQSGIQYLLGSVKPDGSIYRDYYHSTYETSIAIVALKATHNNNYTDEISRARDWLVNSQWDDSCLWGSVSESSWYWGGFGYGYSTRPDLSNTQFAVLALDAADLPKSDPTWTKVVKFASRSQNRTASNEGYSSNNDGGFNYIPGLSVAGGTLSIGSTTGAGIWSLALSGLTPTDPRFAAALNWVANNYSWDYNPATGGNWDNYGLYYYYLSMSKALSMARKTTIGGVLGIGAHDWYKDLSNKLASSQRADGSWVNSNGWAWENIPELATSYALLALQTRTLPPGADLEMVIILHSPADLHLYDAEGRHVGKNYSTGGTDLEIPGSTYSSDDLQTIRVKPPVAGNYHVEMVGTADGEWTLEVIGLQDGIQVSYESYQGMVTSGAVLATDLNVGAFEGSLTIFSVQPAAVPVLDVVPSTLNLSGSKGDTLQTSFTVRETGGSQAVEAISILASDLINDMGSVIPGASLTFEPTGFDLPAGTSQLVHVTAQLPPELPDGVYSGLITVESVNAGARRIQIIVEVISNADVSLTKTSFPNPVTNGQSLTYTLTVSNNGPGTATGVILNDTLPPGVAFVSASPSQGTCTQAGGIITCSLGDLAIGTSGVVTIVITPMGGCSITNTASVTAHEADPDPSNNSATESTRVLLDSFNRPNGGLGTSWAGAKSGYKIVSQQVDVEAGGSTYWYPSSYAANQEACITLPKVDPRGQHQSVMLKMQGTSWRSGSIFVFYNAVTKKIGIETYVPNKGWATLATFDATLVDGDQLGGRAEADGTVRAFVNGVEIGTANAGSFFLGKGGRIGLWFIVAANAVLDDFAGGTIAP